MAWILDYRSWALFHKQRKQWRSDAVRGQRQGTVSLTVKDRLIAGQEKTQTK